MRHLLSSVDIPCPATSHPPIGASCMSSQRTNPVYTISVCSHRFIWSHFSWCVWLYVSVSEWRIYRDTEPDGRRWRDHASSLKEAKSGESHARWGFAVDATRSPLGRHSASWHLVLAWWCCMSVCVVFNAWPTREIFRFRTNTDLPGHKNCPSCQTKSLFFISEQETVPNIPLLTAIILVAYHHHLTQN